MIPMPSFQIALSPTKRAAGRFVLAVRRNLQRAFVEENKRRGLTQSQIARELGVHRSVINRELRGAKDLTLSRVAELAYAMGRKTILSFPERQIAADANHAPAPVPGAVQTWNVIGAANVPTTGAQQSHAVLVAA